MPHRTQIWVLCGAFLYVCFGCLSELMLKFAYERGTKIFTNITISLMKRIISIIMCLAFSFMARANDSTLVAQLDSVSYARGYLSTASILENKERPLLDRKDFEEYICGMEEQMQKSIAQNDPSYSASYNIGAMLFFYIAMHSTTEKDIEVLPYVLEGVRRVTEGRIELPTDTLKAVAILKLYNEGDAALEGNDENVKREFYIALGMMAALRPEDFWYSNEAMPDKNIKLDKRAYAVGVADIIELVLALKEQKRMESYTMGKLTAISVSLETMNYKKYSVPSFVAGAKAALNLGEQLIDKDLLEGLIMHNIEQNGVVIEELNNDFIEENAADEIETIEVK